MDSNPIHHPSPAKNWNAHFWIMFKFWWSAGLVDGLEPHLPPLSSQQNEMLIFALHSTSDDRLGWSMDGQAINGLKPYPPPLSSQQNEMLVFGLCSTSDDQAGWLMDSNPICHLFPATKLKCLFLDYVQILMIGWGNWWTWTPSATPLQPKNEMLIFGLH